MSDTIGFERDDQPDNETNDVDKFVALYDEIVECRRTIDAIRYDLPNAPTSNDMWASYRELDAVLKTLGVSCPWFEQEYGGIWNRDVLYSLFLQKIAIFARLADLESAREYYNSTDWKAIVDNLLYGPPIDTPKVDDKKVVSALLAAITAIVQKINHLDYADPKEFAVAVQHVAMRTTELSQEERSKLHERTEVLRRLCS